MVSEFGLINQTSSTATVNRPAPMVNLVLLALKLRTGWHGGCSGGGQAHSPVGDGPAVHAPPSTSERVQTHRSPSLKGSQIDCAATVHRPLPSGPSMQGLPSLAHPQTHCWFGLSY